MRRKGTAVRQTDNQDRVSATPIVSLLQRSMKKSMFGSLGELTQKEVSAEQLLSRIVDVMAAELHADRATIYWLDRRENELVSVVAHLPEIDAIRVPVSQGVAGYVARSNKVVNIKEAGEDVRFWPSIDDETGYRTHSMLAGPIVDDIGRVVGVVQFLNKQNGEFGDADEEKLEELAAQASLLLRETTLSRRPKYINRETTEFPALVPQENFNKVVGSSPAMRLVYQRIHKVAPTDATVLFLGESGTGKTLLARTVHHNSDRANKPFVHVDCTTLPQNLIENELFGHEKGAYTGASTKAIGKVEAADGGTLFLDEVGDLPLAVQGKLLNLLQGREFSRVGSNETRTADVRFVAATNRDLETLVAEGRFREDLYYRLRVVQIDVPPLRARGRDDLVQLINHFVDQASRRHRNPIKSLSAEALDALVDHSWPGNVRELENCLEAAVIFADSVIQKGDLTLTRRAHASRSEFEDMPSLEDLEARYIEHVLRVHDGNRTHAAETLGIGRNTLLRKMKSYGID